MDEPQTIQHEHKKHWYDRTYKFQLIISLVLILGTIIYLFNFYSQNGDLIYKDVSLKGGTTMTVFIPQDISKLEQELKAEFPDILIRKISDLRTGAQIGFIVESSSEPAPLKQKIESLTNVSLTSDNSSTEFTGSALSSSFYQQLRMAIIVAFIGMGIVVFLIFRTPIPSLAVIAAAFADIIMTVAVLDIAEIKLSVAGIVALLMLIGYSVDTDILLTSRVLKGRESINQRISGAFKTGMTMTLTVLVAVAISLIFTYNSSETLRQMFTIILIGLGFDIFNTWVTNASILKWYAERKKL